jgi:mannose-6-phosphate isomerase-like protein (cupin superfamily)
MSYNPHRHGTQAAQAKRQRNMNPHAGVKLSDIIARQGPQAATIDDYRGKVETPRGWRVEQFKGDTFEMIFEFICSKNSTGMIKHETEDRSLRVLGGELFVQINGTTARLRPGNAIAIPAGTEYSLATSGTTDAEVIFCQGAGYEDSLEQLSDPCLNDVTRMLDVVEVDRALAPSTSDKARAQAERIEAERRQREAAKRSAQSGQQVQQSGGTSQEAVVAKTPPRRAPLTGQQVQGMSPRPIGASGYGD